MNQEDCKVLCGKKEKGSHRRKWISDKKYEKDEQHKKLNMLLFRQESSSWVERKAEVVSQDDLKKEVRGRISWCEKLSRKKEQKECKAIKRERTLQEQEE
jgi:hypothetical protein